MADTDYCKCQRCPCCDKLLPPQPPPADASPHAPVPLVMPYIIYVYPPIQFYPVPYWIQSPVPPLDLMQPTTICGGTVLSGGAGQQLYNLGLGQG